VSSTPTIDVTTLMGIVTPMISMVVVVVLVKSLVKVFREVA
jgi:hypothetical protein